jgi:hypothetical protein
VRKLSILVGAVVASLGRVASAHDSLDPPQEETPPPPRADGPVTPAPAPAPETAPPAPSAPPAPGAEPPPADGSDLEMHVTASRPADMASFADESAKEARFGTSKARYSLNFFGDTFAGIEGGTRRSTMTSFGVGGFSFLFTGDLGGFIKATAEPAIEFDDNNAPGIDLERLTLRAKLGNAWVEAGRSHADLGYWNVAYHHGKWLQPTIERPRVVRFEDDGGILPVHWVGAQVGYAQPLRGDLVVTASASVGNSRGAIVDDIQNVAPKRSEKQGYAKLELKGLFHRDFRVGVAALYGRIPSQPATIRPSLPDTALNEYIGNVYVAFPSDPFFVIAEGYAIRHSAPARSWETYDAFVVAGFAIPPVTPYISAERLVMTAGLDPFFVPDPAQPLPELDVLEGILGVRLDVSTWSAVKVEYRATKFPFGGELVHTGIASWQFGI